MNQLYHVVCRDCATESLRRSEEDAARVADDHAETADHEVAVARVH
ncbi:hypothetical protein [Halobaculum lipolyticum]|uniref:DUF1059 domain-containing protein n=1 Tax=Halobaculum lipolyticum TaxID=3032001 RepID=A0ABD5W6Z0_9EURY|nr:hypothetical protein [Halobaculum sp. DT31]